MIPVDEEKGFQPLATIWKSLEQRFDVPESILEHLRKVQQFKRKETQSINEYFMQLVAKANKVFPGTSAAEIGKHVVDTFALNDLMQQLFLNDSWICEVQSWPKITP